MAKVIFNKLLSTSFIVAAIILPSDKIAALTFNIDPQSDIVGELQMVTVESGDNIHTLAREFDVGVLEIMEANPQIKNPHYLKVGTQLIIPTQFILPPGPRRGMVINLAELRVYYYPPDGNVVITHPVAVGRKGWLTPIGQTSIIMKKEDPTWTPPDSIREYSEAKGIYLPKVVPAGPNNPLGQYAMHLGWTNFVMHGTNAPNSIGLRSSSGCIRMFPEDIQNLFEIVDVGTNVRVIYEPFKVGMHYGQKYLEAHGTFSEEIYQDRNAERYYLLQESLPEYQLPGAKVLVDQSSGYPAILN